MEVKTAVDQCGSMLLLDFSSTKNDLFPLSVPVALPHAALPQPRTLSCIERGYETLGHA